jgi:cystathionine beta-synthase
VKGNGRSRRPARGAARVATTRRAPVKSRERKASRPQSAATVAAQPEGHSRNQRPYDNVLETIGWTPLIRLHRIGRDVRTPIYGKAEFFNPGGSVKDRIGLPIIERAEREGQLRPGGTIVEGTSGNTGVGLAIAAALKGYKCVFTMPDKMSQEKVRLL